MQDEYKYRIELLTNELEKSSEAYQQKNIECEEHRIRTLGWEQKCIEMRGHYEELNHQFEDLTNIVKAKTIECEEARSKYQRLAQITVPDYEEKLESLVEEVEILNGALIHKAQECESQKAQFIDKLNELNEERQKSFHMDNFVKQIKTEKLEALHRLNECLAVVEQLQAQLKEAEKYKIQASTLELDIETIRMNYTSLFEQHLEEIQKLRIQNDTLRQMNENNLSIQEEKFVQLLQHEKIVIHNEIKEQVSSQIVLMENQIGSLKNQLESKQNEIDKLTLQKRNLDTERTNSLLIDKNMKLADYQNTIQSLQQQLSAKSQILEQLQAQVKARQLVPAGSHIERAFRQLQEEQHGKNLELVRLQQRTIELQEELSKKASMKVNYEGQINTLLIEIADLKRELNSKDKTTRRDQDLINKIQSLERANELLRQSSSQMISEQDAKIQYLLSLVPQSNSNRYMQSIQEELSRSQSNLFYHEEDSLRD